jgi:peptidoglycan/LPS O-acetylase OafA/YrhL
MIVVVFYLCESHATSHITQLVNHDYLAVGFFFLLSGFVCGGLCIRNAYLHETNYPRLFLTPVTRSWISSMFDNRDS